MQKDYRDVGKRSYKARGCLFMLRKNTQRSWGMKWLEGVDNIRYSRPTKNMAFP